MGLREDFRNGLDSILSAMPDAAHIMRYGETEQGRVVQSSSVDLSGEATSESGANEKLRVIVNAGQFPSLGSDALVYLDGDPRIVTSLRSDPVGASMTVGLSDTLCKYAAQVIGTRHVHPVLMPIDVLASDNGKLTEYADGYAPVSVHSWTIVIPRESWNEVEPPQVGDEIRLNDQRLKISFVNPREKYFSISARSR